MDKRIVIIGAGAAGIAAGTRLLKSGFTNVTILEAETRIGGRVHSVPYGNAVIELGAQWCHGEQNNVVFQLAKEHDLLGPGVLQLSGLQFRQSDGTQITAKQREQLLKLLDLLEISDAEAAANVGKSVGDVVERKVADALATDEFGDVTAEFGAEMLLNLHMYNNGMMASDSWSELSLPGYVEYEESDGDQLLAWKDGKGYRTILDLLMQKIPDPSQAIPLESRIQLGKTVRTIRWSAADNSSQASRIECTDGSTMDADHIIWTGSLGVLQKHHTTLFEPMLPDDKVRAIGAHKLGTVAKMFVEFEHAFWPNEWSGFSTLWRTQDVQQIRAEFPDDGWLTSVSGVYRVDRQPTMLCFWVPGQSARDMSERPEADVQRGLLRLLDMFLIEWRSQIPMVIGFRRSQWNLEANFLGTYSYQMPIAERLNAGRAALAAPLGREQVGDDAPAVDRPVLQFAGEATSANHYGTVHGAIESGWREADRLIELYKIIIPSSIKTSRKCIADKHEDIVYDVLILGAGLAGLGAASKFSSTSKTFLILEGQTQAGGRVSTQNLLSPTTPTAPTSPIIPTNIQQTNNSRNGQSSTVQTQSDGPANFIDSGAQWLHGKCNRLHTVAEKHNLLSDEQSEEGLGSFIRDDGIVLDAYLVKKTDFLVGQILTECEKYARLGTTATAATPTNPPSSLNTAPAAAINSDGYPSSVSSFLLEHFQPYLDSFADSNQRLQAQQLLDWHVRFQVIDNSCLSLDDVSAKSWGKYSYNGESCQAHYNFRRGFSSAVDALVADIGAERFRYRCDVQEVRFVEPDGWLCVVRCADGRQYRARHVLCTFSMGSLKYGLSKDLFRPSLPARSVQAIRDIGFETINKLFLQFDAAWWGDLDGIQLVFKNDHYENDNWTRHISGFDVMRPGPANTLLAWVGGHGAREMELLTDRQIVNDCVALLTQFTGQSVPQPIRHYCTRWHTNPFVRGAYSYISTSCDRNGTSSSLLAQPICVADMQDAIRSASVTAADNDSGIDDTDAERPLLLFAGEAVHDQYFSTAHGAFLSGIEQASKIIDFYDTLA